MALALAGCRPHPNAHCNRTRCVGTRLRTAAAGRVEPSRAEPRKVEQQRHRVAIVSARKDNQEVVVLVAAHMQNTTRNMPCTPGSRSCRRAGSLTALPRGDCGATTKRCAACATASRAAVPNTAARELLTINTTSRRIKSDKPIVGFVRAAGHQRADTLKDRTG